LIIISQFSGGGIQFSILRHHSAYYRRSREVSISTVSALTLSFFISIIVTTCMYFLIPIFEGLVSLDNIAQSILLIIPAIIFFSQNKILLMTLNGCNRMSEYAFFNTLRFIILLVSVVIFYYIDFSVIYIPIVLAITEGILFVLLFIYIFKNIVSLSLPRKRWFKRHFIFGMKGMPGGALMEANTRIDILMIGVFLGYTYVGIYSFAAMIAEGFSQVYIVLKNNVDPVFGNAFKMHNFPKIYQTITDIRKSFIPILVILGILLISLYKFIFIDLFQMQIELIRESWPVLFILVAFVLFSSFYRPFIGLLNQVGRPQLFSLVIMISVFINVVLNIILLPILGINGAALSTGIAFLIETYLLYRLGINILKGSP